MRRAFAEAILCGTASGALGCFVLVRRLAFLGESVAHTVVLGAVLALIFGLPVGAGAALLAVITALLTAAIAGDRRFSPDTATGILLPSLFGAGVALLALAGGYRGRLEDLLFGSILGVSDADVLLALGVGLAVVAALALAGKELVLVAFDRPTAQALGYRVALLDALLLGLVALTVVVGLRAVGSLLVAGLLLGPPVAARVLCRTFWPMTATAGALGAGSGVVGLYVTWYLDIGAGPAIVLVVASVFLLALLGRTFAGRGQEGGRNAPAIR
ncbi:MAG: metal ABC transporter permease [Thermoleophilaceae bacterium]|jgi:manganese/iron transport system permease protein|nr:metal ABC transporter permease [Thermoleophilaceae bacterium]